MRKILTIARHEYLVNVRRPGFVIMTLLIPALGFLALLVAAFYGGQASKMLERQFSAAPRAVGIVDGYGAFTPILPAYQDRFRDYPDEAAGRAALEAQQIDSLLLIPADYLASGRVAVVTRGGGFDAAALEDSSTTRSFLIAQLTQGKVSPELQARLAAPMKIELVNAGQGRAGGSSSLGLVLNMLVPYFFGFLLVMTVFTSSGYLLRGVADEKASRVIEIVLSSVTARQLLAGKVIGLGAVGLTQVVVWLASAVALSGGALGLLGVAIPLLARPEIFVLAIIYYVLGFLVYAVLMGAGGALGTNVQESQQLAGIFSMVAAVPYMLGGFLFTNPNMTLARVLSWFPLTAPSMMLLRVPMTQVPVVDIVGSIAVLLVTVPLVLWGGAKVFRMGLLMYGKRPTLKQVARALKEA